MHKQRKRFIRKILKKYSQKYPHPETPSLLEKLLESEASRVYLIVDRSILRARIKRAKYAFWITVVASVIIVGLSGGFTSGAVLPFVIPILTIFIAWFVTICTIPTDYNERILGGLDTIIQDFEKYLVFTPDFDPEKGLTIDQFYAIKKMLKEMSEKIDYLNKNLDAVFQKKWSAETTNATSQLSENAKLLKQLTTSNAMFIAENEPNPCVKADTLKSKKILAKLFFWKMHISKPLRPDCNRNPLTIASKI